MVGTVVVALLVLPLLAVALAPARGPAVATAPPARTRRRWRVAGCAVGTVVAVLAAGLDPLGRGVLLAAPLFGLCLLAGVVAGESRALRPTGSTRQAALETRQLRHHLPRRPARAVVVAGLALAALSSATTAAASPDDQGRAGRVLAYDCGTVAGSHGPWAGSFYSLPLLLVAGVGVLIGVLALRRVVGRPRPQAPDERATDDAERHRSATVVTGAVGVLIAIPLLGLTPFTVSGLLASPCRPLWWTAAATLLVLLVPAWLALLTWSAAAVLRPATSVTVAEPVPA
ncbi:hypothetical protein [Micromonospora auratinigra]|uniref:Uncharacterized protein n=1 Tax=Micromonospora auratinigra TaxID=261654 RepID=A0A1A9A8K2_9ACTN|nr:hypothetical protein [Micromonospora auratinigra]SBT52443.1 hypothetical protein GA0070611_5638 [Micromonospora auratinigra]